jgi:capsular exopolysaccharide synthesis family protein
MKRSKALVTKEVTLVYEDFLQFLNSHPGIAQSYETLLSSLHLLNSTRPLQALLVTSAQPGEGKTTVTVNLALTLTLAGKKALLLDADLRKPRIHQIFKLENTLGLTDIIHGTLGVQDVIQGVKVTDGRPENEHSLSVITSGRIPPNSFHAMGSPHLKEAIAYLKNVYDVVLVDSPPTLSVSDSLLLAPIVDGVILVLSTGVITEKEAQRAKERLREAGGHILGVVLNRFQEKLHGDAFHPYAGYY